MVMTSDLTIEVAKQCAPKKLRDRITQGLIDKVNACVKDPDALAVIRENFIGYMNAVLGGRYSMEQYLNAVKYVSFRLMGDDQLQSYTKAFPEKMADWLVRGVPEDTYRSYISAYNRSQLVTNIMEQSYIPTWILNQDIYQEAINAQAKLMKTAKSEMVRTKAADSILQHLTKPEVQNPLVNINMTEGNGIEDLKKALVDLAQQQKQSIMNGTPTKEIAEARIVAEDIEVNDEH